MARTLTFTGELSWPLEDGKQAAKVAVTTSLVYTSALYIEKVYAAAPVAEELALPMAGARFLLLQATTNDLSVKLNDGDEAVTLTAGTGFIMVSGGIAGVITKVTVSGAVVPATLKGYAFA